MNPIECGNRDHNLMPEVAAFEQVKAEKKIQRILKRYRLKKRELPKFKSI